MKLHQTIAQARDASGLTLRQLEKRTGLSNALLSQIETGRVKEPGFRTIVKISRALRLSLNQLAAAE